jgi:protein-S-isoprenylcysteine O-methyltransferase Ste14
VQSLALRLHRLEFEARIFVSFGIVAFVCALSFLASSHANDNIVTLSTWIGLGPRRAIWGGYLVVAGIMLLASIVRMWAGSALTSHRMMAFRVQKDFLITNGPYRVVRNPIYFADLLAFCAFAACLKPVGVALPVLFYVHYSRLIAFEEKVLYDRFQKAFASYVGAVPRFFPRVASLRRLFSGTTDIQITFDGFRHNALYLLFIPGFVVAAATGSLLWAIIIGLPGVVDWAVVHTRKGLETGGVEGRL